MLPGMYWLIWALIRFLHNALWKTDQGTADTLLSLNLNEPQPQPEKHVEPVGTFCASCGTPYKASDYRDDALRISCTHCHVISLENGYWAA